MSVRRIHTYSLSETPSSADPTVGSWRRGTNPTALIATIPHSDDAPSQQQLGPASIGTTGSGHRDGGDVVAVGMECTTYEARWRAGGGDNSSPND